jgi:deoxyhypusine synthase
VGREDYLGEPVKHIRIMKTMTVDQLIRQFRNSGSFGAGRLAAACDIYEKMLLDEECTIFLALSGAVIPAGMRQLVTDLIRSHLVDVVVSTGACMVHDAIEALQMHHYKASPSMDDMELYKYHLFRIYDVLAPEEGYVRLDYTLSEMYGEIADEKRGAAMSSREFAWEIGKRLKDPDSILRAAYEEGVPIFMPSVRDSEFGFIHWLHSTKKGQKNVLNLDAFKEVPEICGLCGDSIRTGMIVIGGGVPRNTVQSATLASKKSLDYAVVVTMDRPETGGLSGSTLSETISWGKMKGKADNVMVIGDALTIFPIMVASVVERLGEGFKRVLFTKRRERGESSV